MRVYLSALAARPCLKEMSDGCYILESFYYFRAWQVEMIPRWKDFILDSGAFTYMMSSSKSKNVDWNSYIDRYIDFINEHNIKHYIEMDIDVVVGVKEVERFRTRLENATGRQCIPVWHKQRGKEYFIQMCKEYRYIAFGGLLTGEFKKSEFKYFKWFIDTAHEYGAKIHGLGYTATRDFDKYPFDSVDSSSWLGSRFGTIYTFRDGDIVGKRHRNKRTTHHKEVDFHNFTIWKLFQKIRDTKEW